jgi:hypothetical protein
MPEAIRFPPGEKSDGILQLVVLPAHAPLIQHVIPEIMERVNRFFGYKAVVAGQSCGKARLSRRVLRRAHGAAVAQADPDGTRRQLARYRRPGAAHGARIARAQPRREGGQGMTFAGSSRRGSLARPLLLAARAAARATGTTVVRAPSSATGRQPDAKVKLVEFFSYTCPHCAEFAPRRWPRSSSATSRPARSASSIAT